MRKVHYVLVLTATFCFITLNSVAQNDSLYFDLGRIKIKREFTQAITVKAKDLQQLSYTNLTDAVAAWFMGAYTNPSDVLYIIDGNTAGDPNMYSLHDIEEITLVQNALIQLNGASPVRQLVLVTTKKTGKQTGIFIAGQTNQVRQNMPGPIDGKIKETVPALFHRYYLSADKNGKKVQYGASVGYLRDAVPHLRDPENITGKLNNFDRMQGNAYAQVLFGKSNIVNVQANYSPQYFDFEQQQNWSSNSETVVRTQDYHSKNKSLTTTLSWQTRFAKKWSNSLNASLNHLRIRQHDSNNFYGTNYRHTYWNYTGGSRFRYYQVRNTVSFKEVIGKWHVEPALSFTYFKPKRDHDWMVYSKRGVEVTEHTVAGQWAWDRFIQLNPTISLTLQDCLNITGGVLSDLNPKVRKRFFSYASATADLLQLGKHRPEANLKVYLSYAAFDRFDIPVYGFQETEYVPLAAFPYRPVSMLESNELRYIRTTDSVNRIISAGSHLVLFRKRLNLQYYFEKRNTGVMAAGTIFSSNGFSTIFALRILNSAINRINLQYNTIQNAELKWTTGLNFTSAKLRFSEPASFSNPYQVLGGMNDGKTGGLTNRVEYKNVGLGVDMLYIFDEKVKQDPYRNDVEEMNSFLLQHVFIMYTLRPAGSHPVRFYLNSRNPVQDKNYRLNKDRRRFYGAGFEMKL
jgi:hypothetical protein